MSFHSRRPTTSTRTHTHTAVFSVFSDHAFVNGPKHADNFAVTLTKQHFSHAPVDRVVISQLCARAVCTHAWTWQKR